MRKLLLIAQLILGAGDMEAQTVQMNAERKAEYKEIIGLDYSMPDYTTSKVDAKVMGPRLAKILDEILDTSKMEGNLSKLAILQARQINKRNTI